MNHVTLITLGVKDLVASRSFYKRLGFQARNDETDPDIVFFETGQTVLALYPLDELAADLTDNGEVKPGSGFSGITLAHNVESKVEVDALFRLVQESGGRITKQPQETFWGGYHFYFTDPDGYYWEVAYVYPQ